MSDNNVNSAENKNNYNKEVQDRYKAKCMQIAIRYGLNEDDLTVSQAIENIVIIMVVVVEVLQGMLSWKS